MLAKGRQKDEKLRLKDRLLEVIVQKCMTYVVVMFCVKSRKQYSSNSDPQAQQSKLFGTP